MCLLSHMTGRSKTMVASVTADYPRTEVTVTDRNSLRNERNDVMTCNDATPMTSPVHDIVLLRK